MSAEVLKALDQLDKLLKGQIVQGGNSEQNVWAGSSHQEQQIPKPAPNGTDYDPSKDIAHKAISEMTDSEIKHYYRMRKSRKPNPRAAELEIERLPGVSKSLCDACYGNCRINKSVCGRCSGFGILFNVNSEESKYAIKSIAEKYNLHKSGSMSEGGATGDADPTPTNMPSYESTKVDNGGKMVAKAEDEEDEYDDLEDIDDVDEEDDEDDGADEFAKKSVGGKKAKKGMTKGGKSTRKSISDLNYGMQVILKSLQDLVVRTDSNSQIINQLAELQSTMTKSLTGVDDRSAARAPKSVSQNVQVLNKGFVDQAPGGEPTSGLRYEPRDIVKAAGEMACKSLIDASQVVVLETTSNWDPRVVEKVQRYMDHENRREQASF